MPVIDLHAHVTPERFKAAIRDRGEWYGLPSQVGELQFPGFRLTLEERIAEMGELGVDAQVLSPNVGFFQYDNDLSTTTAIARECNDEIAEIVQRYPDRFSGLGTLPMQDVAAAVAEMERVMQNLGFKGVIVGDHVNGEMYDLPRFRPFFQAAESLGAIVLLHQGGNTVVFDLINRYQLANAVGNLTERTIAYGAMVFGGVLDDCPRLKPLLAHAGGYVAFGAARMDKAAGFLEGTRPATDDPPGYVSPLESVPEGAHRMSKAPSSYLGSFYYDCCTFTGRTLRFLIDMVGIDRVVLGTDYPAPMVLSDAVNWLRGLECLTADEKTAILSRNPGTLLET